MTTTHTLDLFPQTPVRPSGSVWRRLTGLLRAPIEAWCRRYMWLEERTRLIIAWFIGGVATLLTVAALVPSRHTGPERLVCAGLALLALLNALQPYWWPRLMAWTSRRGLPVPRHEDSAWFARASAFWMLASFLLLALAAAFGHGGPVVCP